MQGLIGHQAGKGRAEALLICRRSHHCNAAVAAVAGGRWVAVQGFDAVWVLKCRI